ncbi:hypothetical protein ABZ897_41595 [Nonomuraea sp. NPDC046802]|uniref:hypothetical protein n=1 Tax=Nonomuraea sp. NPDC046802 TaxID=3154919 RepID=UPI0033DD51F2
MPLRPIEDPDGAHHHRRAARASRCLRPASADRTDHHRAAAAATAAVARADGGHR